MSGIVYEGTGRVAVDEIASVHAVLVVYLSRA